MIFRRTKSLVGLDIGSSAVKAVELRRVSSGYRVVAMGSEPLPPDCIVDGAIIDGGVVSDVIRQLFDRNGIKTKEDDRGAVGTSTQSVTVATSQPTALFVFSPSLPSVGVPVFFDASGVRATVPGRTLVSHAWVFGDGSTASGKTTSHAFTFAGTFNVTLTVTDNVGERNTSSASVLVGGTVTAAFTATNTPLVGDRVVNFDASASTGTGLTYTWNFGDGDPETVTNATITHAFQDDAARNVVLTVTDVEGNSASITNTVTPEP